MSKYTQEELLKYQEEINHFYRLRKLFLGLGFAAIGTGIVIGIPLAVAISNNGGNMYIASYFISLSIVAGIILFILRGALFNRRIKNRKIIIAEAKKEYEIRRMFKEEHKE